MTLINFWFAKKPPYVRNDARKGNVHETLIDRYLLLFQNPTFHGRIARISFLGAGTMVRRGGKGKCTPEDNLSALTPS